VTESRANKNRQEHKRFNLLTSEGMCLEQQQENISVFKLVNRVSWKKTKQEGRKTSQQVI